MAFDRHLVLEQLGGWRGMLDASLPTIAFIIANSLGGLTVGIWAAVAAAVLVFLLRLVRKESIQQAISGLFAVAVAVLIAARTGQARDFFVLGIVRNAGIGVVLFGSLLVRWPLVGVVAEFLAPSHLGTMSAHRLPSLRSRLKRDPAPAQSADGWLTVLWGGVFLLRAVVQWVLYRRDAVELLGTSSLVLGLPLTAVELVVTLWVVARLHRHRSDVEVADGEGDGQQQRPAA
jgi:hypothetical protein